MSTRRVKVLYIGGMTRSGSTVLARILGEMQGFFYVGELYSIWDKPPIVRCGCGLLVRECRIWKKILGEAFGGMDHVDVLKMFSLYRRNIRSLHIPLFFLPGWKARVQSRMKEYVTHLEKLYRGISATMGCKVIVDSSKLPTYGYLLGTIPAIDLYVIHLVRDPRAVAYSWLQHKRGFASVGPVKSSLSWDARNLLTEVFFQKLGRAYLRLRYSDFVARPQGTVQEILTFIQEDVPTLPFAQERLVKFGINHSVEGHPDRFSVGETELRPDEEWKANIKLRDRIIVELMTWPFLRHYGYGHMIGRSSQQKSC